MAEKEIKVKRSNRQKTLDMVYIAIFAVIIAVCSWISVPMVVPFTLQTFGVFCAVGLLGGKRGTLSVLICITRSCRSSGICGIFKRHRHAVRCDRRIYNGIYIHRTYLLAHNSDFRKKLWAIILGMVLGLLACYAFGTIWFMVVYAQKAAPIGLAAALMKCVVPFLIPDALKIALAVVITKTVPKYVKIFD